MSSIDERVNEAIQRALMARQSRDEFQRVREFVNDARERGLLVQKKYDLPLVDTIGRTAFRDQRPR